MSGGSVAGVFGLVQMYRQAKLDSDYKLMNMSMELADASYDKTAVSNKFIEADTKLREARDNSETFKSGETGYNDTVIYDFELPDGSTISGDTYQNILRELENVKNHELAKVAAEEQEWQTKFQKEQTHNAMLQTNIQNYEAMLQGDIQGNFTYGYQQ